VTVPCVFEVAATAITVKVWQLSFGPGESFAASVGRRQHERHVFVLRERVW